MLKKKCVYWESNSNIDQNNFQKMLEWLNSDLEQAAQNYESIRLRLTKIFHARGCQAADELVDQTIDRVVKKIDVLIKTFEGNPHLYFYGVAKNVYKEYTHKPRIFNESPVNLIHFEPDTNENELRDSCLTGCLKELSSKECKFILKYYQGEKSEKIKQHKQMCKNLKITSENLRLKAYRIRRKLQKCVIDCLN